MDGSRCVIKIDMAFSGWLVIRVREGRALKLSVGVDSSLNKD